MTRTFWSRYRAALTHSGPTYNPDLAAAEERANKAEAAIVRARQAANDLDWMAASTVSPDDRQLYRAIAADLRRRLDTTED